MTIVACPKCGDSVALPGRASRLATVRCPLCQEQFPLGEVLDKLPPALVVIADPEAAETAAAADEAPGAFAAPALSEPAGDGGFAPLSIGTASAPAPSVPRGRRPPVRAKRKPKNPVVEGIKIVLGGVAGLAIAQLILWWIGSSQSWPKQRADMFSLAPKVARFAPWIVPERYRGSQPAGAATGAGNESTTVARGNGVGSRSQELPQLPAVAPHPNGGADLAAETKRAPTKKSSRSASKKKTSPETAPEAPTGDGPYPAGGMGGAGPATIPEADLQQMPELNDQAVEDLLDLNMTDDTPVADPDVSAVMEPETEPAAAPAAPPAGPLPSAPRTTAAELRTAVDEAQQVVQALAAAPDADARALLRQAYVALAKVGETAAYRSPPDAAELQAAEQLLRAVSAEKEKLATLGRAAGGWLKTAARDNNGVLLVGKVKQTRQQGAYRVIELLIPGREAPLAVYSDAASGAAYPAEAELVVLGAIVSNPGQDLAGYEGDGAPVVWQAMADVLPAP